MRQPPVARGSFPLLFFCLCCCFLGVVQLPCIAASRSLPAATRTVRGRDLKHKSIKYDIFTDHTPIKPHQIVEPVPDDSVAPTSAPVPSTQVPSAEQPVPEQQLPEDEAQVPMTTKGKGLLLVKSKGKGVVVLKKGKGVFMPEGNHETVVPEDEATNVPGGEGEDHPGKGGYIFKGGSITDGKSGLKQSGKSGSKSSGKSGRGKAGGKGKGFDLGDIFAPTNDTELSEHNRSKRSRSKRSRHSDSKGIGDSGSPKGVSGSMKKRKSRKWAYHKQKPNPLGSVSPTISPMPTRPPSPTISPRPTPVQTMPPPTIPATSTPVLPEAPSATPVVGPPVGFQPTDMPVEVPVSVPTELPQELPSVDLTPYTLLYELPLNQGIPSEGDVEQVVLATADYLRGYFIENVAGLEGFLNYMIDDRFNFGEPYRIDYNATATFLADSVVPDKSTLDAVLASAFQEPALSFYLTTISMLPADNPFSSTTGIELGETPQLFSWNFPRQGNNDETSTMSTVKYGAAAGAAAAALVGVFVGLLLCRRRKQQASGSVKSKDYPVNDTPTLAGETCEETTVEFEHRSRTASENAQSEFGLSTHFEEEQDASGLSDRNSDTNMFDIMETTALFQKPLEESIVEEQSKSRTSDQPPTPSTTAHSENEKSRTPPISIPPPPTSSAPDDEFDEYEYELETLESSKQESERLVASSSGRFSGALEGDESAKEDVFLIGDVDSEEEEEVPVRVIDMIKRFG